MLQPVVLFGQYGLKLKKLKLSVLKVSISQNFMSETKSHTLQKWQICFKVHVTLQAFIIITSFLAFGFLFFFFLVLSTFFIFLFDYNIRPLKEGMHPLLYICTTGLTKGLWVLSTGVSVTQDMADQTPLSNVFF